MALAARKPVGGTGYDQRSGRAAPQGRLGSPETFCPVPSRRRLSVPLGVTPSAVLSQETATWCWHNCGEMGPMHKDPWVVSRAALREQKGGGRHCLCTPGFLSLQRAPSFSDWCLSPPRLLSPSLPLCLGKTAVSSRCGQQQRQAPRGRQLWGTAGAGDKRLCGRHGGQAGEGSPDQVCGTERPPSGDI